MSLRYAGAACALLFAIVFAGCASDEPFSYAQPDGWEADGLKWWAPGTDTSLAFRDLSTLASMGVKDAEIVYGTGAAARESYEQQLKRAVKQSLIELIRNEPEVVDSLLEKLVIPKVRASSSDVEALVARYQSDAWRSIGRHFRGPRETVKVGGPDVPVVYPDSLRKAGVAGAVEVQVYLDEEGVPQAIWTDSPVHPVLDAITMQSIAKARWQPAYLLTGAKSEPLPSWVRFRLRFG